MLKIYLRGSVKSELLVYRAVSLKIRKYRGRQTTPKESENHAKEKILDMRNLQGSHGMEDTVKVTVAVEEKSRVQRVAATSLSIATTVVIQRSQREKRVAEGTTIFENPDGAETRRGMVVIGTC